jgi:serine/threonine protein kinase
VPAGRKIIMVRPCQHPTVRARRPALRAHPLSAVRVDHPHAGQLLAGRYRLSELVGRGATGSVWRAYDEVLTREIAVKHLADRHSRGFAEARIAARVRHPNVATVHDAVKHGDSDWLVMDYHGGGTFADLLRRRRRLPPPVVAALGLQLLAALAAVHDAGVVHCDVKPANLLIGQDGRLVLTDFGIAETGDGGHPARENGDVVGSPAYIAPELVRGETPRPPADSWSLGATLYTAVEGRPPFEAGDTGSTLVAVLLAAPAPTQLAGRLAPLLYALLTKEPARRPSHDAIRAALTSAASPLRPAPSPATSRCRPQAGGADQWASTLIRGQELLL